MGNPTQLFTWTSTGNYPAGPNPWNGQPLALAPINTFYTPDTKLPAEEINYVYGQLIQKDIAQLYANGPIAVASYAALKALPIPSFNPIAIYSDSSGFVWTYYYSTISTVPDNSIVAGQSTVTSVQPTAVSSGPGRWRLAGGPLFDAIGNGEQNFSGGAPSVGPVAGGGVLHQPFLLSSATYSLLFPTAGSFPVLVANDIIDLEGTVDIVLGLQASQGPFGFPQVQLTKGGAAIGNVIGQAPSQAGPPLGGTSTAQTFTVPIRAQYFVTSADVSSGNVAFQALLTTDIVNGSFQATLQSLCVRIRRQ
jgi:hypothetical protein